MISVIIPIYNGIEFIDKSVMSVINQTFNKWELLIGINGHEQDSEVYKKACLYENEKIKVFDFYNIKGKSNTLNELVKYCKYNYIALLDVDDIWHPRKLESQYKVLGKYDVIGTKGVYFGDKTEVIDIPINNITSFDFFKSNPIINSSCIIRKNLCKWDNVEFGLEDYYLWLKLRKLGHTFYNVPLVLVKHRIYTNSAFNNVNNNYVDKLKKRFRQT
jgi:glycosyltransferase involved in cell wall biosynthesis